MSASKCSPISLIKSAGGEGSLVCLVREGAPRFADVSLLAVMEGEPCQSRRSSVILGSQCLWLPQG
jgi:hypothetical protein